MIKASASELGRERLLSEKILKGRGKGARMVGDSTMGLSLKSIVFRTRRGRDWGWKKSLVAKKWSSVREGR